MRGREAQRHEGTEVATDAMCVPSSLVPYQGDWVPADQVAHWLEGRVVLTKWIGGHAYVRAVEAERLAER